MSIRLDIIQVFKLYKIMLLLIVVACLFLGGNYVYLIDNDIILNFLLGETTVNNNISIWLPLIVKIGVSDSFFIFLYTLVDKMGVISNFRLTFLIIIFLASFYLPFYEKFFYSTYVHYFSVSISIIGLIINFIVMYKLSLSKWKVKYRLFSRISTTFATVVEIATFVVLLDIGFRGFLLSIFFRICSMYIFPKLFFSNHYKQKVVL